MTWSNTRSLVYTLIYELGHTAVMVRCQEAHNVLELDFKLYLVESPLSSNELCLTVYLEENAKDPRMKRLLLCRLLNDTYSVNFVSHRFEAAF